MTRLLTQFSDMMEEKLAGSFLFIFIITMVTVSILGHTIVHYTSRFDLKIDVSESGIIMALGMVLGGFCHLFGGDLLENSSLVKFSPTIFFLALLPPILFNEGYHMRQAYFFGYIKEALLFAVVGTGITSVFQTLLTYYGPVANNLSFAECAAFGGVISATDTVGVLSVLSSLRVEPALFYLVFGESCLNDAVSLTIFEIASEFIGSDYGMRAVGIGIADFVIILLGSCAIGYLVPCITAYGFNRIDLRGSVVSELGVYILMSYAPFLVAEIVGMSGIVSILIAGIATRSYAHRNLSSLIVQTQADFCYRLVSYLADNAVFLYMGTTVFSLKSNLEAFRADFLFWTLFSCLLSRFGMVVILGGFVNIMAPCSNWNAIQLKHCIVMAWAGLRGAVAFAAAVTFSDEFGNHGLVLTTTMGIIIISTYVLGPLTKPLIVLLKLPMNVEYDDINAPRMWRFGRWLKKFDEKYIDKRMIMKCAQRGGPCAHYHLPGGLCPTEAALIQQFNNNMVAVAERKNTGLDDGLDGWQETVSALHANLSTPGTTYTNGTGTSNTTTSTAGGHGRRNSRQGTDSSAPGDTANTTALDASPPDRSALRRRSSTGRSREVATPWEGDSYLEGPQVNRIGASAHRRMSSSQYFNSNNANPIQVPPALDEEPTPRSDSNADAWDDVTAEGVPPPQRKTKRFGSFVAAQNYMEEIQEAAGTSVHVEMKMASPDIYDFGRKMDIMPKVEVVRTPLTTDVDQSDDTERRPWGGARRNSNDPELL